MRPLFGAVGLGGCKGLVEVVARQLDRDLVGTEHAGLVDLLLRRGDRHEDRSVHAEMAAGKGHALGMVAGAGADKLALVGALRPDLAHRAEGPAQLVAADGGKIFPLEEDVGPVAGGQVVIPLQRRPGEQSTQGGGGLSGSVVEPYHPLQMPEDAAPGKECLRIP